MFHFVVSCLSLQLFEPNRFHGDKAPHFGLVLGETFISEEFTK